MLSNQVNGFHRKFFLSGPYIWINVRFYLSQAQAANFSINRLKKKTLSFLLATIYLAGTLMCCWPFTKTILLSQTKLKNNSIPFGISFPHSAWWLLLNIPSQGITNNLFYCNWICFISYQIIQKTLKLNRENNLIKTLPRMSWWSHAK